jgi:hypothetical protein
MTRLSLQSGCQDRPVAVFGFLLAVAADSFVHNLFGGLDTVSNNQDFSLANSAEHLCGPLGNLHPMPASSGSTLFFWLAGTLFLSNILGLELEDRG